MDAVLDANACARRPRKAGAATRAGLAGVGAQAAGLNALASPAMAARPFGAI